MRPSPLILVWMMFLGVLSPLEAQRTRQSREFPFFHEVGLNEAVDQLAVDHQGRVWFSTQRLESNGVRFYGIGHLNENGPATLISTPFRVHDMVFSSDGTLWMIASGKLYRLRTHGTFELQDLGDFSIGLDLATGPDHKIYSSSFARNQILKFDTLTLTAEWLSAGPQQISFELALSPFGEIWFSTNDNRLGLRTIDGKVAIFDLELDFASDRRPAVISGIAADQEGGAWLTVTGGTTSLFHQPTPYVLHIRRDGTIDQRLAREFFPYSPVLLRSGELIFLEALDRPYRARLMLTRGLVTREILPPLPGLRPFRVFQYYEAAEGKDGSTVFVGVDGGIFEIDIPSRDTRLRSRRK